MIGRLARRARQALASLPSRLHPKGQRINWYFATNEAGCEGDQGLHAKLAVLSALRNTRLVPHLITTGFRNDFTRWMEDHGVKLVNATLPFSEVIEAAALNGTYSRAYIGHWLRCEIPLIERKQEFVLYTDTDVVFLKPVRLGHLRPFLFASAPEFQLEGANYVNTGVMLMNVRRMRASAPGFFDYIRGEIAKANGTYHDQYAYNRYYRNHWTALDPLYNWKPYWPTSPAATVMHFHGAKLNGIRTVLDGSASYEDGWWRVIGSLVASFQPSYAAAVRAALAALGDIELPERSWIEGIAYDLETKAAPVPSEVLDLSFMNYKVVY
jgi:hypothetical protein